MRRLATASNGCRLCLTVFALLTLGGCSLAGSASPTASHDKHARQGALGMIRASRGTLAPVYGPLAEQIATDFDLADKAGIGIDVGSGPGTLIIELCKRTTLHWINADINPHFFPYFCREAETHNLGHRISAIFADAQDLPFRDNFADIIVSRGSFHLWPDKVKAFTEIYRVLKPGAPAYIGRGFSENLPLETAKDIRAKQGGGLKYDVDKTAAELRRIMSNLAIKEYRIHRPGADSGINYGVWLEFHKPARPNMSRK